MAHCVPQLPPEQTWPLPQPVPSMMLVHPVVLVAAWQLWQGQSVLVINHYGLNLADPNSRQFLKDQMEAFFFAPDAQLPEVCSAQLLWARLLRSDQF